MHSGEEGAKTASKESISHVTTNKDTMAIEPLGEIFT